MIRKKLLWSLKRHPFLYLTRFRLLSRTATSLTEIEHFTYNVLNKKEDIPSYFKDINSIIFPSGKSNNDFELVTVLSIWLFDHIKGGPGLSEPSDKALKIMLEGKGGVCSDMAQCFNNFCVLNDIQVREWGTTRAPFDRSFGGHSFSEVYSKELKKWFLIDVYNCLIFYNGKDELPLSVIEMYTSLAQGKKVFHKSFNPQKVVKDKTVQRNFLHPNTIPFLICNYSNTIYDSYLKRYRPHIPVFVIHFWMYLIGKSYYYLFPLDNHRKIFD